MASLIVTILISALAFIVFFCFQLRFFSMTKRSRKRFASFFERSGEYGITLSGYEDNRYPQLDFIGKEGSDLNKLLEEINRYLYKTKGTSDYEYIRNKVERKLNVLYDQSIVYLSFPTYLGLMGTFCGVFLGILMFLFGFDNAGNISDESIKNLLIGVLVSMGTSLVGLYLTIRNQKAAGQARKKVEDDKNDFYDFIQADVTKTANASLVIAISKLHETVDSFEPAFTEVIDGFKQAFADCTKAFGEDFRSNVNSVVSAVNVMGNNMDKINENIKLQEKLLSVYKSNTLITGLDKFVAASERFANITQSLDKFEEARRMMLAAAQEAIVLQNQYSESLRVPREVAIRVNQILDRIKDFERNINTVGENINRREILGNDVIDALSNQINGILKKCKVADRYIELSDENLEELYKTQTSVIADMNRRYREAIENHITGFENMIRIQTFELQNRHSEFVKAMEEKFNVQEIRQEFSNLKKLDSIEKDLDVITNTSVTHENMQSELRVVHNELEGIKKQLSEISKNTKNSGRGGITIFGR
jgi:hypothetical protein